MVQLSDNLTWAITNQKGSHNALYIRNRGAKQTFTKDRFSLTNMPTPKNYFGNSKAVGIVGTPEGNATMLLKTKNAETKPAKNAHKAQLNIRGRGTKRIFKTVSQLLQENRYAPGSTKLAAQRVTAIALAGVRKQQGVKYTPKGRTNK
mmetsp:Transcript_14501/g.25998  ORF Transcript_14501/g.25998 Transcript_14501/m.25998 type:complete len:148 (+) Transcript_14501:77-520(+)